MTPDLEQLSAYVDGELDPAQAATIARLVAADERLARRVAKLAEMKGAVAGLKPEVIMLHLPQPPRWRLGLLPLVAAVLGILALGGVLWQSLPTVLSERPAVRSLVESAADLHDRWAAADAGPARVATVPSAEAPELLSAGLSVAMVDENATLAGRRAIHTGYVGQRGCRLSLFALKGGGLVNAFRIDSADRLQTATWSIGDTEFLVVARGMDESRFAVVAAALKSLTTRRSRPDGALTAQLETARQPCLS